MIQVRRTADHDSFIFEVVVREGKGVADRGVGIERPMRIVSSATHWPRAGRLKAERTVSFHKRLSPHLRFVDRTGISFSKRTTLRMRQRAPRPTSTRDS